MEIKHYTENKYQEHLLQQEVMWIYDECLIIGGMKKTVLDVGCGPVINGGTRLGKYLDKVTRYVGIDPILKNMGINVLTPDVVVSMCVLEEVNDLRVHLELLDSKMGKDTTLFVFVPNCSSLNRQVGMYNRYIDSTMFLDIHDIAQGHKRMLDRTMWKSALEEVFDVKSVKHFGFKPVDMQTMESIKHYWHQFDIFIACAPDEIKYHCAELGFMCVKKNGEDTGEREG